MTLEWLPQALQDFTEIVDYLAADNPVAALEQGDEIQSQIKRLLDTRHIGRPGRVRGTRELVIVRTPYVVAYRIKNNTIHILRILHGSRLWPGHF